MTDTVVVPTSGTKVSTTKLKHGDVTADVTFQIKRHWNVAYFFQFLRLYVQIDYNDGVERVTQNNEMKTVAEQPITVMIHNKFLTCLGRELS